jgi:hypothetical protein
MSFKVSKSAFDSFVKFSEKITPSYPTSGSIIPVQAIISMFEECECLEVTLISFTLDSPPRPRLFKDGQRIEPDQFVSRGKATIIIGSWYTHILMNTHLAILFFMNNCAYYWTFLKRGGKSPIFVFSQDMIIYASPALTQI